ncbi:MAG: ABC transporter permease [Ruminococcus sp.]|nr:ABC transporter permease [Ruminococcus sp.]
MKKALLKDTFREIKVSAGRFISILAIVALGCGFFAGLKATMPDMTDSANEYFEEHKLMDCKLMSTVGVSSSEVEAVKKLDSVEGAMGSYSKEVFYNYDRQNYVLKALSYIQSDGSDNPNLLNTPVLIEGKYPENDGECLIEKKLTAPESFKIGSTLELQDTQEGVELSDSLEHTSLKIVGICASPLYIGYKRDNTKAGNGSILCNIYLPEKEFKSGVYTECYVRFKDIHDMDQFSDEYKDKVAELMEQAQDTFEESVKQRYDKQLSLAKRDISLANKRLAQINDLLRLDKNGLEALDKQLALAQEQAEKSDELLADTQVSEIKAQRKLTAGLLADIAQGKTAARDELEKQAGELKETVYQGEQQIALLGEPKFYSFDRFDASSDYSSFNGDANKIDSISKVFPVFFILIACLVCLTTMTRMVEEHRIRIGTYKALGYSPASVAFKYLVYGAAASVIGSCIGTAVGLQIFPKIIYSCYKILYNIPSIKTPFKPWYMLGCCLVSVVCICGAILYSCMKALRSQPSSLMRPKAPQNGRRVLLERVGFVWKRLSFLSKVTVRNLLRYKKRFFMTIIGVAGCTALIITGFGLKHSISSIVHKQFGEILLYDGTLVLNTSAYDTSALKNKLASLDAVESFNMALINDGVVSFNGKKADTSVVVAMDSASIHDYLSLKDVDSGKALDITDDGCIITKKMSMLLGIKKGDVIEYELDGEKTVELKVTGIAENYALHYLYITSDTFKELYGSEPVYNMAYVNLKDSANESDFKKEVISCGEFYGVSLMSEAGKDFLTSLDSLDAVVILLIVCAGLLAIVVLYNLANINITERVREIATIKVLGFYDIETSAYIYRENVITSVLGILAGFLAGIVLHHFVVITSEVDIVLFDRSLVWWSFLLGALFTVVFTVLVNFVLHFKLKKIDMVESMKSVE